MFSFAWHWLWSSWLGGVVCGAFCTLGLVLWGSSEKRWYE